MSTTIPLRPPVRAAFHELIDYAGLFPPAKLPMDEAATEYAAARTGPAASMLGRFIVPASRLTELLALRQAKGAVEPQALSVIVDASRDPRQWFASAGSLLNELAALRAREPGIAMRALEAALPPLATARETFDANVGQLGALVARAGLRDVPVFAELPEGARRELVPGAMAAFSRARLNAKLRCGGLTEAAFPPVDAVAQFVAAAAEERVAFKATAGLHHPVRHVDAATGFTMHGFLNLLAAAAFAPHVSLDVLCEIVDERDAQAFSFDDGALRWRDRRADVAAIAAMRASAFVGYGSCSFSEPVDDLIALGVLAQTA